MTTINLRFGDDDVTAKATQQQNSLHVNIDDTNTAWIIRQADPPFFILEREHADGRRQQIKVAITTDGDKRQVWLNGRLLNYERIRQRGGGKGSDGGGSLSATIPAVVSQILIEVGDTVSANDKLILLESMKMVIPIQAPYAGTVTAINCAAGDSVQPGHPLVELEKEATA